MDQQCRGDMVCGINNCRKHDPFADRWWDCCQTKKEREFFLLRNKAFQRGGIYLGTHRKNKEEMVMAIKTMYENNHRIHWYYENGYIISRENDRRMAVDENGKIFLQEPSANNADNAVFKFVDHSQLFDDYEIVQNMKTQKVLAADGNRKIKNEVEYLNETNILRRQLWLREPLLVCEGDDHDHEKQCGGIEPGTQYTVLRRGQFGNPKDFFNRTFKEYEEGFGEDKEDKEYWIGLKNLSRYTHPRCHWELNITVWDFEGKTSSGHYSRFFIKEGPEYTLTVEGFFSHGEGHGKGHGKDDKDDKDSTDDKKGKDDKDHGKEAQEMKLLDGLSYSNNRRFSTWDYDQDNWGEMINHSDPSAPHSKTVDNCSRRHGWGGWWYRACSDSQLTGLNLNTDDAPLFAGIFWSRWKDEHAGRISWPQALMTITLE